MLRTAPYDVVFGVRQVPLGHLSPFVISRVSDPQYSVQADNAAQIAGKDG